MSTMTESWDVWSAGEKDQFQSIARKLLRQTFLVRDKDEESRRNYFFLSRTLDTFQEYFGYIGFEIILDRDNGVGMLRSTVSAGEGGRMQTGHLRLRKGESLVLCCLWTIYADRVLSGTLRQTIQITLADLRMEMGKYGFQDQMDKSGMMAILNLFARYQLIGLVGQVGDEEMRILLYPSLQLAMNAEAFTRFALAAAERMKDRQGDTGIGEDGENKSDEVGDNDESEE